MSTAIMEALEVSALPFKARNVQMEGSQVVAMDMLLKFYKLLSQENWQLECHHQLA